MQVLPQYLDSYKDQSTSQISNKPKSIPLYITQGEECTARLSWKWEFIRVLSCENLVESCAEPLKQLKNLFETVLRHTLYQ